MQLAFERGNAELIGLSEFTGFLWPTLDNWTNERAGLLAGCRYGLEIAGQGSGLLRELVATQTVLGSQIRASRTPPSRSRMNLVAEVTNRVNELGEHPARSGFSAALRHIRVADRYFDRARNDRDDDLYNDVVYRSNQAFEGALKEAYAVLTKKDPSRLTPHSIEQYLIRNRLLSDRVLDQLTSYRTRWRNPSTHDHRLFLGQDEALLAVVNVSAFAIILLEQVTRQISADRESEAVSKVAAQLQLQASQFSSMKLPDQLLALSKFFWSELSRESATLKAPRDAELVGRLAGFLRAVNPRLSVEDEPTVRVGLTGPRILTDLLVRLADQQVPVEIISSARTASAIEKGKIQMLGYLTEAKLDDGVLLVFPPDLSATIGAHQHLVFTSNGVKRVHVLSQKVPDMEVPSSDTASE